LEEDRWQGEILPHISHIIERGREKEKEIEGDKGR
jgi:hypothetical protein